MNRGMVMANPARPKRLKKYRVEKGITIYELAEVLGVNHSTVSYWENGKKYPRHEKIIELEDYFERPYRDLFTDLTDREMEILENLERIKKIR